MNESKLDGFQETESYGADHFINPARQHFYAEENNIQTLMRDEGMKNVVELMKKKASMIYNEVSYICSFFN